MDIKRELNQVAMQIWIITDITVSLCVFLLGEESSSKDSAAGMCLWVSGRVSNRLVLVHEIDSVGSGRALNSISILQDTSLLATHTHNTRTSTQTTTNTHTHSDTEMEEKTHKTHFQTPHPHTETNDQMYKMTQKCTNTKTNHTHTQGTRIGLDRILLDRIGLD